MAWEVQPVERVFVANYYWVDDYVEDEEWTLIPRPDES